MAKTSFINGIDLFCIDLLILQFSDLLQDVTVLQCKLISDSCTTFERLFCLKC